MRRPRAFALPIHARRSLIGAGVLLLAAPALAAAAGPPQTIDAAPRTHCTLTGAAYPGLYGNLGLSVSAPAFVVPREGDVVKLKLTTNFEAGLQSTFSAAVDRVAGSVTSFRVLSGETVPPSTELLSEPLPFGPIPVSITTGAPIVVSPPEAIIQLPDDLTESVRIDLERFSFSITGTSSTDPLVQEQASGVCEQDVSFPNIVTIPVVIAADGGVGISQITPVKGRSGGGTTVTVSGPGVGDATAVFFGPNPAASFSRISATQVKAVSPVGSPGNAQIKVVTPAGTSPDTAKDDFTYTRPVLTSLGPNFGSSKGHTFVYVQGTGLDDVTGVTIGGQSVKFIANSTDLGHFSTPPGTGTVPVVLNSPAGDTPITDDTVFMYNDAVVTPQSAEAGGGTVVTISGIDLTHATGVTFSGKRGSNFVKLSPTSVQITTPPLGSSSIVRVQFDDRPEEVVGDAFGVMIVEYSPWIQSISPSSGPVSGGTEVTINGASLGYGTEVLFGGRPATVVAKTNTQLTVIAPPGAPGKVDISIRGGFNGTTPNTAADDYSYLAPVDPVIAHAFGISGSATLKTLAKGSIALTGATNLRVARATGELVGQDLTLNPASAKLTALGFLPVTAKLAFTSAGPLSGSLAGGALSLNAKVRIRLPVVTLFGMQLAGGASCQTRTPSVLALKAVSPWPELGSGGTLAGTFAISDLTGCGGLTGIVSPLTAGKGNAIALNLTP